MKFKELWNVLGSYGDTLSLSFGDSTKDTEITTDCIEILSGLENYEVLKISPCNYVLAVTLEKLKEAKK